MKIADNLELLRANKDAIRNAITRKGVLTGSDMSTYADNIMQIGRGVFPDIPDLSPITIQDDVMYFTVAPHTYWGMSIGLDTGTYQVENGTIVDGVYVSNSIDSSSTYINNTNYYCVNNTDAYIVYRLTCTSHINMLRVKSDTTKGTLGIIEVYGAMPYVASMSFNSCATLRICTIKSRLQLITNMSYCFSWCSSLTTLDSSSWVLSAVTGMAFCFLNCSSLTTLDSSSWVLSAVTDMRSCFQNCSSLTTLDSSSWVLSAVTNMANCFQNCYSLTIISNLNFQNITDMSSFYCPKLVNFRFLNYGARGDYKTAIQLGSQVYKADIIQFFSDMFDRATAGYSVLTVTINQPSSKFTASEISVATNKGYTITFNG